MVRSTPATAGQAVCQTNDDAEPRVIRQFTSVFLVSRCGELWRVYDSAAPDGADRRMPSAESTARYRIFLALAHKTEVRAHVFTPGARHAVDAAGLQAQLDDSVVA
jgi:hypothetical protein